MLNIEDINSLDIEDIYTFRFTNKFVNEFKSLKTILSNIESKPERTKNEEETVIILYFMMGKMKDVINLLRLNKFDSPKFKFIEAIALKNLGYINDSKNLLEELLAGKDIKKDITIKELVEIYLNLGDEKQAQNLFAENLQNSNSNFAKFIKARLMEFQGNVDGAVKIYEELKEIDEFKVESLHRLFYLANIYLEPQEVKKYEEQVLELPPAYISIIANLALYYDMNNKYKEAKKQIETISGIYNQRLNYLFDEIKNSQFTFFDEDVERQKKYTQKLIEIPIDATGISIRTRNILSQKNIKTIGDLVRYTETDIQSINALGESGFKEIKDLLVGLNLEFAKITHVETEEEKKYTALLNQPISNVFWTPRTRALLDKNNIKVWGDLANLKEEEINKWQGINIQVFNEIKQKMLQQGIMFK